MSTVSVISQWYPTVKAFHVTFAVLSLGGFVLRGGMMWSGSRRLSHPLVRRLPHVNDSLLFLLGLLLLWSGPWSLASAGWLQLKLICLLCYIGLGFIALHRGHFSRGQRLTAWLAGVLLFLFMLWLAIYKPF